MLVKVLQLSVQDDPHPMELSENWRPGLAPRSTVWGHDEAGA